MTDKPSRAARGWVALNSRGVPILGTARNMRREAVEAAAGYWRDGWKGARKQGWRVVRCTVVPQEASHDD